MDHRHDVFVDFLQENGGNTDWIENGTLPLSDCIIIRVYDAAGTVAYFWAHWVADARLMFHGRIATERQGPESIHPETIRDLTRIAFWLGADVAFMPVYRDTLGHSMALKLIGMGFEIVDHAHDVLILAAALPSFEHRNSRKSMSIKSH
ncbi:hypothetical protein [Xanthobacter flavus]|uniref:hypothetical protein n=1 Tax=Xanthobacter flavus TaxID=281 RepID=UPI00372AD4D2